MARPKRMGAYNALDDLLPGGAWGPSASPRLEPVPDPPRAARRPPGRPADGNALDDLLPGPRSLGGVEDLRSGPRASSRGRGTLARGRRAGRHLGVWNPLDDLPPAGPTSEPGPAPARTRVSFRLPADLVEEARDAVAHLAGTADRTTLTALTERALRTELARLAATGTKRPPFPPRTP